MIGYELKHDIVRQLGDEQIYIYLGARIVFDLRKSKFDVQLFSVVLQVGIVNKVYSEFRMTLRFLKSQYSFFFIIII